MLERNTMENMENVRSCKPVLLICGSWVRNAQVSWPGLCCRAPSTCLHISVVFCCENRTRVYAKWW